MTPSTLEAALKTVALSLCLAIPSVMCRSQAVQAQDTSQSETESDDAQTEVKKKHVKRKARQTDRDVINQLRDGELSAVELAQALNLDASRIGATIDRPTSSGLAIIKELQQMSPEKLTSELIPAIEAELIRSLQEDYEGSTAISGRLLNLVSVLGAIGEDARPSLHKAYGYDPMVDLFITRKLGPDAPAARVDELLRDPPQGEYRLSYYIAALTKPGREVVPILLENMKNDEKTAGKYASMLLDLMGPECVPQVAATLDDTDWFARWSAARTLEMMGPKAEAALPTLEKRFGDPAEDLDVRVAAARAIARIQGIQPEELYRTIHDLESRLVKATHEKSLAWRKEYMTREASKSMAELAAVNTHISGWGESAWTVSAMMTGQNLAEANAIIRRQTENGYGSSTGNIVWIFMNCHSKADRFPGRLEPDTEAALKEYLFRELNSTRQKRALNTALINEALSTGQYLMTWNDDYPLCIRIRDYLVLSVLKDDPAYCDKTLVAGDTLQERYEAYVRFYREALKHWALYGIQYQLGSSAYTYKTYPHYFNLMELAPDPIIRQRARMYMDLVMMESAQISISGLRGGTKGRAKRGGLGDRWDPIQAMLYGERGSSYFLTMPAASGYQAPEPAVLLRKLGTTAEPYEIINDRETYGGKECNAIHYAWGTPEYVAGCGMYDPNLGAKNGSMGRWSGVIFRNLAAISLDAYTGEKWNVQHKDVRITQLCSDGPYVPGNTCVVFEALLGKVSEKDGCVFVNNDEAYAVVKVVSGGYFWADSFKRQMYANDIYSPIIIQTGRRADYGSFEKFQKAILAAPVKNDDNKVEYHGPNAARVEFFPMTPEALKKGNKYTLPKVDGKTVDLDPEYAYSSPYMQNKAGSAIVTLRYGDRAWEYDFGKNTITEMR